MYLYLRNSPSINHNEINIFFGYNLNILNYNSHFINYSYHIIITDYFQSNTPPPPPPFPYLFPIPHSRTIFDEICLYFQFKILTLNPEQYYYSPF